MDQSLAKGPGHPPRPLVQISEVRLGFSHREGKGVINGMVAYPDKFTVLFLGIWAYLFYRGCGIDVYRKNVWTVWSWSGLSR